MEQQHHRHDWPTERSCDMTPSEIRADLEEGTRSPAPRRPRYPRSNPTSSSSLLEIFASNANFTAVDIGDELMLSCDGSGNIDSGTRTRRALQLPEPPRRRHPRALPHRLLLQGHQDDPVVRAAGHEERPAQSGRAAAVRGDARPGPLLAARRAHAQLVRAACRWGASTKRARAQEEAIEHAVTRHGLRRRGHDRGRRRRHGLRHLRRRRRRRLPRPRCAPSKRSSARIPDIGIELGMASEFVLGMHGELEFQRPAPGRHVAARPGRRSPPRPASTMFGPAVNVNTDKSVRLERGPRAARSSSPASHESPIPVHMNAGMGVGGVPMTRYPPTDAVSRAAQCARSRPPATGYRWVSGDPLGMACTHALAAGMGGMRDRRRSGGPHADDPGHAPRARPRPTSPTARRERRRPLPTRSSCTTCGASSAWG